MAKLGVTLLAIAAGAAAGLVATAGAAQPPASGLSPEATIVAYCGAWNTADPAARDELLARSWAEDGVYTDNATHAVGRQALSDAIGDQHRKSPGVRFRCSAPQVHHGAMRMSWVMLGPDGKEMLPGTDFSELAPDGRIRKVVGFFGPPPAP